MGIDATTRDEGNGSHLWHSVGERGSILVALSALVLGGSLGVAIGRLAGNAARGSGQAPPEHVRGRVLAADGSTVGGAVLTLTDGTGAEVDTAVTEADGDCVLTVPGPGRYVLIVATREHPPEARRLEIGEFPYEFTVWLTGKGMLGGFVREESGYTPVGGAVVVLTDPRGQVVGSRTTDETGGYAFDDLPAGDYVAAVNHPSYRPVAVDVPIAAGDPAVLDVELVHSGRLHGVVRDRAGNPVCQARVVLADASGMTRTVTTGERGEYGFHNLPAGEYVLGVPGGPERRPVRVNGPETVRDLEI